VVLANGTVGSYTVTAGIVGGATGNFDLTNTPTNFVSLAGFDGTDGNYSVAPLVQATNGNLYGTTASGGANGDGAVFQFTTSGTPTTLHSFDSTDGADPEAGLIQASNGNLYGTTASGGTYGDGTVFEISASGKLKTLHSFDSTDGEGPLAGLVQATNGDLYGTTCSGGANRVGTVFQITTGGTLTTLHSFAGDTTDGSCPAATLVQAANGNLYGTTASGGSGNDGTFFQITTGGTLTTLHSFGITFGDGANPTAALVQATDGNLYGTTDIGSATNRGTVFKITTGGTVTILHSFGILPDGQDPRGGLIQNTNGNFYGTTASGGANNSCANGCGTVFNVFVGLRPFVETQTTSAKVGATIKILGTDLTGTTSVKFNGTAATFTVVSNSEITAKVPADATTGPVEVTTPSGTLTSNAKFEVKP
jgi:uncharacterized repeat protein (TIGR03803 family)